MTTFASAQMTGYDVGMGKNKGDYLWDKENDEYVITGKGNFGSTSDAFFFLSQKTSQNHILSSQAYWKTPQNLHSQQCGIMLRENLQPDSRFVALSQNGENRIFLTIRNQTGMPAQEIDCGFFQSAVLWIEKVNQRITAHVAAAGQPLQKLAELDFAMDVCYYGLFVASGSNEKPATAYFYNVRLYFTAAENFVPYHDYIGSQLEIMDVNTGRRKIVYRTNEPIEAPNWTRDGRALIFNSRGLLYRLEIGQSQPTLIPTHFATSNNNDHGISPDGKWLAISHHDQQLPSGKNSRIFILPIEGGMPRDITPQAPSYWHGWSPDGKWLVYTAMRNNKWNIFKIPVDGGIEIQLTDNEFLNDGPDFSPDGNTIWFNSNRNGKMQIWRMQADGSEQMQVTHDEFNNWFPHPSPQGDRIIFLSYPPEVNSWDHPYYKNVMLQIMDTHGANQRVIAYLYGGQGTINVPSWSPDGNAVAFVSNSDQMKQE